MMTTCRNLRDGGRSLPNQTLCPHSERMCWLLSLRFAISENQFNMKYFQKMNYMQSGGYNPEVRPKRQRPQAVQPYSPAPAPASPPSLYNDAPEEDLGFFNEVSFPDIGEFGLGWEPQKLRRKREAREYPYLYSGEHPRAPARPPAPPRRQRHGPRKFPARPSARPQSQSSRRKGPGGFWDDPDFDADFFSGGGPSPQSLNTFDAYSNSGNSNKYQQHHSYYPQQQPQQQPHYNDSPRGGYRRPHQRPKITPTRVIIFI